MQDLGDTCSRARVFVLVYPLVLVVGLKDVTNREEPGKDCDQAVLRQARSRLTVAHLRLRAVHPPLRLKRPLLTSTD